MPVSQNLYNSANVDCMNILQVLDHKRCSQRTSRHRLCAADIDNVNHGVHTVLPPPPNRWQGHDSTFRRHYSLKIKCVVCFYYYFYFRFIINMMCSLQTCWMPHSRATVLIFMFIFSVLNFSNSLYCIWITNLLILNNIFHVLKCCHCCSISEFWRYELWRIMSTCSTNRCGL